MWAGVGWLEDADPGVSARVRAAADLFPSRAAIDFPVPDDLSAVFMHEAANVHRDLFAEHRDLYGRNVRAKIEDYFARCRLAAFDARATAA